MIFIRENVYTQIFGIFRLVHFSAIKSGESKKKNI